MRDWPIQSDLGDGPGSQSALKACLEPRKGAAGDFSDADHVFCGASPLLPLLGRGDSWASSPLHWVVGLR